MDIDIADRRRSDALSLRNSPRVIDCVNRVAVEDPLQAFLQVQVSMLGDNMLYPGLAGLLAYNRPVECCSLWGEATSS